MMTRSRKAIVEAISVLLILLFGYAATSKLINYEQFTIQIGVSPILHGIAPWLAWMLPAIELLSCVLLVLPRSRLTGLYLSMALMVVFTSYIMAILSFSSHVPCSCGGVLSNMGWKIHLVFNVVFTCLALVALKIEKRHSWKLTESVPGIE